MSAASETNALPFHTQYPRKGPIVKNIHKMPVNTEKTISKYDTGDVTGEGTGGK
jgi:hypothetical protein